MKPARAPAISAPPGRPPLDRRLAAMRRAGMSATAIRRALGLSAAQAVAAGIVAPGWMAARPAGGAGTAPRAAGSPPPPGPASGPRMAEVLHAVAQAANLTPEALRRPGQDRRVARPRQLAMYLVRTLCPGATLPAIGFFLGRDHSTVLHGCRKAAALLERDAAFQALCARARAGLAAAEGGGDGETPA